MAFNIFNSSYFQQNKETLAIPIEASPQKENHEMFNNERSFLSDFNIEDELFAGMSTGGPHNFNQTPSQQTQRDQKNVTNLLLFPTKSSGLDNDQKLYKQQADYQQQIPHQHNQVLSKLVGTKRRKIIPSQQLEQEQMQLRYEQAYEAQNNRNLMKQLQSTVSHAQQLGNFNTSQITGPGFGGQQQQSNVIHNFPNLQNILNESMTSNSSQMLDPAFYPVNSNNKKKSLKTNVDHNINRGGCTGGPASSYHSSMRGDQQVYYTHNHDTSQSMIEQDESGLSSIIMEDNPILDNDQFKKHKKRQQNKESAVRSRLKKKAYYDTIESQFNTVQLENNKLKLDNAALRAENQVLRQYLDYFEDIFRKKNQLPNQGSTTVSNTNSVKDLSHSTKGGYTPQMYSGPSSRQGGLSDDEIYNGKAQLYPFNIRKRSQLRQGTLNSAMGGHLSNNFNNTDEVYSQMSADNEAPKALKSQKLVNKLLNSQKDPNAEVSFVLERKGTDSTGSNSPGKLGMFTIALVMCICCFSSFFTPGGQDSQISAQVKYNGLGRNIMNYNKQDDSQGGNSDDELQQQPMQLNLNQLSDQQKQTLYQQQQQQQQQLNSLQQNAYQFSIICWGNFLKVMFLIFFAILILTFPMDDIKQWAARRAYLRKIFNLNDLPLHANKNIKNL